MAHDRSVAGIRCSEVLRDLSDYLDGDLPPEAVRRIEDHLRGCDWCARFGGDFAGAIKALRSRLGPAAAPPAGVHERLMARLEEERGSA
ncbi:MAG: hypothetical protein GWM90_27075 [Gemmatimonadetes bacterium]|nr:hypothetical protein [Gemmatimonadota bacterium]NIQ58594.1 hypothetical protein [Gemmatimonadota bacterium]NIU78784.1 hypothetical protein [Gammaproteobacteria bacterium]NIX47597.1 hypothetical protein [Gemmatimonadota bacterium]NIY11956.1 hypothetical protein [Gemmatimonadota bacterium]